MAKLKNRHCKAQHGNLSLVWLCARAFGCGCILCVALLMLSAALLTYTPIPLNWAQPLACLAASSGAILSGWILANKIQRHCLLLGTANGAFYATCLLVSSYLENGKLLYKQTSVILPLAVLLGGALGGALSAVKVGQ